MFKIRRLPKKIMSLIIELQIFFDDYQWLHFYSLLISLILTPYKSTVNGMVKVLGFGTHRSKHNAFLLNSSEVLIKALRFYAYFILNILKKYGEPIFFIIDDTSNKKRGKHIDGAYNYFDHISKKYIWGQQIVCSVILYREITIPFGFAIYLTKQQCKELGIKFKKKTDIALELLKSFEADNNQNVFVLADTYYATKEIISYSRIKRHNFISQLKSNRVLYVTRPNGSQYQTNVRKYLKNKSFKDKQKCLIGKNTYRVFGKKVNLKTGGVVKIVLTKCSAHRTATVLFSINTALPINTIIDAYVKRWKIEIFFKMSKQHLGFNAYQNTDIKAINSHLCLSMFAHNLLTHAFISELRGKGKLLTRKNISNLSILDMQNKFRYDVNIETFNYSIEQSDIISKNKIKKEFKKYLVAA